MAEARGFCTCKRDFPQRKTFHPPANATWHYLCDKPVMPPVTVTEGQPFHMEPVPPGEMDDWGNIVPTGTGWPMSHG